MARFLAKAAQRPPPPPLTQTRSALSLSFRGVWQRQDWSQIMSTTFFLHFFIGLFPPRGKQNPLNSHNTPNAACNHLCHEVERRLLWKPPPNGTVGHIPSSPTEQLPVWFGSSVLSASWHEWLLPEEGSAMRIRRALLPSRWEFYTRRGSTSFCRRQSPFFPSEIGH